MGIVREQDTSELFIAEDFKISVTVVLKRRKEHVITLIRVQGPAGEKSYNSNGYH